MAGPLDGIRVIDLSQIATGPVATMMLADQGADVIKVEPHGLGDKVRAMPSFSKGGLNAFTIGCNRGKRSLCIDVTTPQGSEVVRRLIQNADVFVQNFRPGVVERLGLDPAELRSMNPRLVTVSITGYGRKGPMANRPVFDPVIQAITGHIALQVNPEIPFPDLIRHALVDKATACYVAQAVSAALYHRERSGGEGQHIDISMVDASLAFLWPDGMMRYTLLDADVRTGPTLAELYSLTQCADGQLVYFTGTNEQRLGLYRAVGHPEWCDDPRFNTIAEYFKPVNSELLGGWLVEAFAALSVAEVVQSLVDHDVPCGLVTAQADVPSQVQVIANESLMEFDHPTAGRLRLPHPPARFGSTPNDPKRIVPLVGQHSEEILLEAGMSGEEIAQLRRDGILH